MDSIDPNTEYNLKAFSLINRTTDLPVPWKGQEPEIYHEGLNFG